MNLDIQRTSPEGVTVVVTPATERGPYVVLDVLFKNRRGKTLNSVFMDLSLDEAIEIRDALTERIEEIQNAS